MVKPSAPSSSSTSRVVVVLPFVPTTCTAGKARWGSPSSARRACIRSRPNSSGHGVSVSSQLTLSAEGIELASVAGELLAFAIDHFGRRVLDEALVAEHAFRARDL